MLKWWNDHKPTTRRLAQLYTALLYNAHLRGFAEGRIYTGNTKAVCVPGFNCYSCPGAVGACPLGSLQNAIASSGHRAGWYMAGILLLFGIALGRTICGWLCPLGMIQELLHKIPTPKIRKSRATRLLSYLKYVVLAVFAVAIPLWYGLKQGIPVPGFCKYICPAGTLEGAMGLLSNPNNTGLMNQLGILFTQKFVIMLVIGLACVFCYRSFCRFLCPLGAIYGLFNRFALTGVKVDPLRCNHCGACVRKCGMDVRHVGDHECISCGECMGVCGQSAISLKCGSVTLKGPEKGLHPESPETVENRRKRGRIAWGVLIAVLAAALVYFNFIDVPKSSAESGSGSAPAAAAGPNGGTEALTGASSAESAAASAERRPAAESAPASAERRPAAESAPVAAEDTAPAASTAPVGHKVGERMADFTCTLADGSSFHLEEQLGKVVFINLWATYCGPCVKELPEFDQLKKNHPDAVILAVHNSFEASLKMKDFLADKDWDLMFTLETPERPIMSAMGASDSMPQTMVLNKKGEIIFNEQRSMTLEMLENLYEQAGRP